MPLSTVVPPRGFRTSTPRHVVQAACHHSGMPPADIRVEPLAPSRCGDFLRFFDHERGAAFGDNAEWAACYCNFHHVPPVIDFDALDGNANRLAMEARIACGEMTGYLAYRGNDVAGWINAQPRNRLRHCEARIRVAPMPLPVPPHEAAAIVCFVVAPGERRRGVARALLAGALADLAARGIRVVDAYPRADESRERYAQDHYRGPRRLFLEEGFVEIDRQDRTAILRKTL